MGRAVSGRANDARMLTRALADPGMTRSLDEAGWTVLLTIARAEQLIGTLAARIDGLPVPNGAARVLADARAGAQAARRAALWEAEMVRRALAPLGVPVVLLKGTAYAAAGLAAATGRTIGDCDILVPHGALDDVEAALIAAGWEWAKPDPYDDAYYRRWMHELPPMIHAARDRMVDVHHTILPLTARPRPDAARLIADALQLGNGLSVLAPADMIVHAAAHLFADGDLTGGLRNLWDIDRLVREDADGLAEQARRHDLIAPVSRALRLARMLYDTPVDDVQAGKSRASDAWFVRRLLARDGWGRATQPVTRLGFYVRSHAIRMPPAMLARHLWTKWRSGRR